MTAEHQDKAYLLLLPILSFTDAVEEKDGDVIVMDKFHSIKFPWQYVRYMQHHEEGYIDPCHYRIYFNFDLDLMVFVGNFTGQDVVDEPDLNDSALVTVLSIVKPLRKHFYMASFRGTTYEHEFRTNGKEPWYPMLVDAYSHWLIDRIIRDET
jgi:hypothetical protein